MSLNINLNKTKVVKGIRYIKKGKQINLYLEDFYVLGIA